MLKNGVTACPVVRVEVFTTRVILILQPVRLLSDTTGSGGAGYIGGAGGSGGGIFNTGNLDLSYNAISKNRHGPGGSQGNGISFW